MFIRIVSHGIRTIISKLKRKKEGKKREAKLKN
jgi:hypothetical protein